MCRGRLAFLLACCLLVDFADPLVPGVAQVELDRSGDAVQLEGAGGEDLRGDAETPAPRRAGPIPPEALAARRTGVVAVGQAAPPAAPRGRPQPRSPTAHRRPTDP